MVAWWGGVGEGDSSSMPYWQSPFPHLSNLVIELCPELTSLPPCPALEFLTVSSSNKSLRILPGEGPVNLDLKLNVKVDNVGYLTALPARRLTHIRIQDNDELKRLSEFEEVFKSFSSLRKRGIRRCRRLTSVSGVFEHLTALESLSLIALPVVDGDFDDDMTWRFLRHNLRILNLQSLQMLPRGMKHLTSLQDLSISNCKLLKGLPDWISFIPSGSILAPTSLH